MELKELLQVLSKGEGTVILFLVLSWSQYSAKLGPLDWPKKQIVTEDDIKKVPGWNENGTKLLHKKVSYLIRIMLLSLKPIALDKLLL